LKEREVLQQEYSRSKSQAKDKGTPTEYQELVDKHRNLMAKFRLLFAVQEGLLKNDPEAADAGEKERFEKLLSDQRQMIEQLEASMNSLLNIPSNEASAADSDISMEDTDEQLLLSPGQGAEIAKYLDHYEGASELVVEVDRAIEQVQKSLLAKMELKTEKEELESATKPRRVTNDAQPKQ